MSRSLRRIFDLLRRVDRADLPGFGLLSSGFKRRVVRGGLRSIRHLLPRAAAVDGFRLVVPDELYFRYVLRGHEPQTLALLSRHLEPGMTAVDVGANIGYFTLHMGRLVGTTGRVWAIEPVPDVLAILLENLRLNGAANVLPVAAAAGASREMRDLFLREEKMMHGFYSEAAASKRLRVPVVPLDEIIEAPVHLVKIDAEGADLEVLAGMEQLLATQEGLKILVEWLPAALVQAGHDPWDLPRFLEQRGFDLHLAIGGGSETVPLASARPDLIPGSPAGPSHVNLFVQKARR